MYSLWCFLSLVLATSPSYGLPTLQQPLQLEEPDLGSVRSLEIATKPRALTGKFLHISDLHADPFYKYHSSTDVDSACHRGRGPAGLLGAETTDCDSPITLINETFRWIQENIRDEVDFVIWTGDSARHDNDEKHPRTEDQVLELNNMIVNKFVEVFGKDDNINDTDPTNDFTVPIIPTYGNNDILPHNIFAPGPNKWTKHYLKVWKKFIPEEQRHGFERGGWFSVEAIPKRLAVFSLNTLYFFDSNAAVDGCAQKSEPGYEQMEWLRIQLQFVRQRGMKAIIMGHVPPARTSSKHSWDETCWQKYTLWMEQYRDVVVGSLYGHMNIDHFMLQDFHDVSLSLEVTKSDVSTRIYLDDEFSVESASDYLEELRARWSRLPDPPKNNRVLADGTEDEYDSMPWISRLFARLTKKGRDSDESKTYKKFLDKIGGPWGERFSLTLVSPSVVPNYYPTLRVIEYNTSGLDSSTLESLIKPTAQDIPTITSLAGDRYSGRRRKHKSKFPKFPVPDGPSKSSPPGPAYSPQTLSWLGYTQYYANLTTLNDDFTTDDEASQSRDDVESSRWKDGKHSGKTPKDKNSKAPFKSFEFHEEYNTRTDKVYQLQDLTVRSYFDLANRIGQYKPKDGDTSTIALGSRDPDASDQSGIAQDACTNTTGENTRSGDFDAMKGHKHRGGKDKKGKKHRKHKKRKALNEVWLTFVRRAFVGSWDDDELHEVFG